MASVNKPTDIKEKEADVNRKLQIYGIVKAFQIGKLPSNDQIDVALNSLLQSRALTNPSERLSPEGRELVKDFREVVTQAKKLLLSKNEGNLLQDFIWQTQQFDPNAVSVPNAPIDKDTVKQHGDKVLEGFRTLGTLIITNGQFRKLLNDATILLRDIAGDAASNAANKVRPDGEALAQIDRPAEDNVWHDTPDLSKKNLKSQLQNVYKSDPAQDAKGVVNAGAGAIRQPDGSAGDRINAAQDATSRAAEQVKSSIDPETRESTKESTQEYRARIKQYLSKKMPEERRSQTIWRLKKMIVECQQHPDYQQAISTLLDLAEEYGSHGRSIATGGTGTVKQTRTHLAAAEADLKTLIERFANGTSTDDLWSSINTIYEDADRDPELKDWFKSMNSYVRRCLKQQGYIMEDASTEEWNRLYDHGNYLLREKYKTHTDRIVNEIKFLADQFDQDAQNKAFAASVQKLFTDLGNDENGKATFKPHLVKDLTDVIIPAAFERIAYIPIPRIEYSDTEIDAVVENLVLESDNFMPNVLEVASDNYFRWGRKKIASANKNSIDVKVTGIQMDLRDVSFYVKRKQGFPSITDTGVANIKMGGDGFCFRLKLSTTDDKDKQHFFKLDKVDVDVKNLQIKLVKSNHKILFSLFKPIMLKILRPVVQKTAEKQLKDQFNKFDQLLFQVKKEADRALDEARSSPEDVPNIYSRYVTAAQKQLLQGKKKVEAVAADKKVNMAVTKEDSIFPDIHLPGGISSKATEYKELARKGEKWESPVFSIGSAPKSSDIPGPPQVTRKPHAISGSTTNGNHTHGNYANGNYTNGNYTNGRTVNGKYSEPVTGPIATTGPATTTVPTVSGNTATI
ncbi:uncharacterized protein F4812DRAFT_135521 [Daldinia caldariorum]|uniref:uncharacterized protein n=1 Tax=Daldinia caldariorum TaxID=326644 RepID=UPI00200894C3|nr:uncharacterized protein F4812DRAFT_135521 [Daldinia caldariorum]KAI1465180.1 hypothetical protein F4812DRAFT_135521 [Daldinia caldariorum]